jgi:hypothetical protein
LKKLSEHKKNVSSEKEPKFIPKGNCGFENPEKNYRNTKSTNQNKNLPKKIMFSTLVRIMLYV